MNKKQKKIQKRIIISAVLIIPCFFVPDKYRFFAFLIPYLIAGYDVLIKFFRNIKERQLLDENFLMTVATVGAMCIGEYPEAVFVMIFYKLGQLFESYAVGKSRKSVASLMNIRPDYANIEKEGEITQVLAEEVKTGDIIIVKTGERIPIDGTVVKGNAVLDTSALTGESVPSDVLEGDRVLSGCINQSGVIYIKTECEFYDSTVSKILEMVENASDKKSVSENFITRFARIYTPLVVLIAIIIMSVPSIIFGNFSLWLYRALIFLVVSCPCALVISVPLAFFCGIGGASFKGILFKGSNSLETLKDVKNMVFDKTGTLTKGTFSVTEITPCGIERDELLKYTAMAEYYSNHPVSEGIRNSYSGEIDENAITDVEETAGMGVSALIYGKKVLAGNSKLMGKYNICYDKKETGTVVYVTIDGEYKGSITLSDTIKQGTVNCISELKKRGIKTFMLTGDNKDSAQSVGKQTGIDNVLSGLLPSDKVLNIEKIMEEGKTAFTGDGINDAPVIARADFGIAMGGIGSDSAIEASDIVIMDDNPEKIITALEISEKTMKIVWQNMIFAISIKVIIMILGAFGLADMWQAVFGDVGVSVIAILNSMRLLKRGF